MFQQGPNQNAELIAWQVESQEQNNEKVEGRVDQMIAEMDNELIKLKDKEPLLSAVRADTEFIIGEAKDASELSDAEKSGLESYTSANLERLQELNNKLTLIKESIADLQNILKREDLGRAWDIENAVILSESSGNLEDSADYALIKVGKTNNVLAIPIKYPEILTWKSEEIPFVKTPTFADLSKASSLNNKWVVYSKNASNEAMLKKIA